MSRALEERRNDLIERAESILGSAKTETRALSADEVTEMQGIKEEVGRITETLKLEEDFRAENFERAEEEMPKEEKMENININEQERAAFEAYIRGTLNERQDVNMTLTDNGALIPTTIVQYIISKVYDICPVLERSQRFNVKGNLAVPFYPADSEEINVAYADEFVDLESHIGKVNSVTLTGFLAGALTKVSRSLINNAAVDVVGYVVDQMAMEIARFIEHECLIGTPAAGQNPAKVLGLSTLSNGITAASAIAITPEELVRLQGCVKDRFQSNAIWIMSPATRDAIRTLKATTGYFLLNPDMTAPYGWTLLGKPVYVSDNMPDIASGKAVIYYGDMHGLATKFSEDINIQILREKFATQHAVGVVGWLEFDAAVVDEQQIAKLTMA